MTDVNDILGNGKSELPADKLIAYLEGKLSPAEQHEVEAWLAEEGMEADALEGLRELSADEARLSVEKINYGLQRQLKKNRYRQKKHFADNKWGWIAVIIILLACVLAFWLIKMSS